MPIRPLFLVVLAVLAGAGMAAVLLSTAPLQKQTGLAAAPTVPLAAEDSYKIQPCH